MGNSEFVLTIFGALAQEESANTSKRVKFSKKLNAEKGRVPNIVYGYDKTKGDYFNLKINVAEVAVIRQIYQRRATAQPKSQICSTSRGSEPSGTASGAPTPFQLS